MITIKDVNKKGDLMILTVETDIMITNDTVDPPVTYPATFNMEIDANADEETVRKHLLANYETILEDEKQPVEDEDLKKKWKDKVIKREG